MKKYIVEGFGMKLDELFSLSWGLASLPCISWFWNNLIVYVSQLGPLWQNTIKWVA